MKHHMRRVILACLSILMAVNIFVYYSLTVYAFPKRLLDGTWIDVPLSEYGEEISYFIQYAVNQMGAVFTRDFETWLKNNDTYKDLYDDNGRLAKNVSIDTQTGTVTYNKEIMIVLKNAVDDYAKQEQTKEENGGFYLLPTTKFDEVPVSNFYNSQQYRTFRNIVIEKGVLPVRIQYRYMLHFVDPFSDPDHPIALIGTLSSLNAYTNDPDETVCCSFYCLNDWKYESQPVLRFSSMTEQYTSCSEAGHYDTSTTSGYSNVSYINTKEIEREKFTIYSTTGEKLRVFVSEYAAKNYSVSNRKIYFTENYYNYEPEDLTVAVDDLQKSVDDLQKVIDELLKQINDNSSEKEIEELLRLILEELRKNPGGGGGSGGGDVTVSVDLKETNNWLYKIYNKVSEINERMALFFESIEQTVLDGIQTKLDEIAETLKKIKNWSAVDTVIDGVDAVADWLDLIHDVLTDGAGSAVSALSSALQDSTDLMKQKFPFSIPWDILFFVSVLSAEPETPQFSIPFNFEFPALDLSVDYEMELDFTPLQWLSDLSRLLLSLTYAAGLMKKTVDIVSANKEG